MSFYDNQSTWSAQGRQPSWEQSAPPSRSGATSVSSNEPAAFSSQIEDVDRAVDNLVKSGKHFAGASGPGTPSIPPASRRESMPMTGRGYGEFGKQQSTRNGTLSLTTMIQTKDLVDNHLVTTPFMSTTALDPVPQAAVCRDSMQHSDFSLDRAKPNR